MSEQNTVVQLPEVRRINWVDTCAVIQCACGAEDLVYVQLDDENACDACGRVYAANTDTRVIVWHGRDIVSGVDA
jgi:hypothetical protein